MGKGDACVATLVTLCEKIKIGVLSRVHVQGHALISLDCLALNVEELGSSLTFRRPNVSYSRRTAPLTSKVAFYIFIQQI